MKKNILEKIEIPGGIELEVNHETVIAKSEDKEIKKRFNLTNIDLRKEGQEVLIESKNATRREATMVGTIKAHINNMIEGLGKGFEYKLAVEFVHFPITVEKSGNEIIIKNFLGEKKPRKCMIMDGADVEISKNEIIVKSFNKEVAGQMSANLEKVTEVKGKDKRKFQDGIYITEKCGRAI